MPKPTKEQRGQQVCDAIPKQGKERLKRERRSKPGGQDIQNAQRFWGKEPLVEKRGEARVEVKTQEARDSEELEDEEDG